MPSIKKKYIDGIYGADVKEILTNNMTDKLYKNYIRTYLRTLTKQLVKKMLQKRKVE